MARYIIGFLLAIGLIVIVIVLIVRALTGGPNGPKPLDLNSMAGTGNVMRLTIDTPVTDPSRHHDIVITVGNTQTTIQVTNGYQGVVDHQNSYPMDPSAYAVFLHALTVNGFTKGNADSSLSDERGQCALGDRYIYEALDSNGSDLERYWFTSCGSGTFQGKVSTVQQLFISQVPDYDAQTNNVQL